jgi:IS1 family transposase
MDAKTRQIIAFHVGDRSHKSAEHLWAKMPQAYRQHTTFYTDQYMVLVSHKFSVQNRGIEFALPDEGELKK